MLKQLLWTALVLSVPFVGSAQNVYITNQYAFSNCSVLSNCFVSRNLTLPSGKYVVNAKLALRNTDATGQATECILYAHEYPNGSLSLVPTIIDRTDVRLPGGDNIQQSIALQGVFQSTSPDRHAVIAVQCNGFNAAAQELVITAIELQPGSAVLPQNYAPFPSN